MNRHRSAFVALLLSVVFAAPSAAQQALSVETSPSEASCARCFDYLEFPPGSDDETAAFRATPIVAGEDKQVAGIAAPAPPASKASKQ